jgi:hypothetical protein
MEVPSWNPRSGRVEWKRVLYAYRHRIDGHLLEVETSGRGVVRVTEAHSLFVSRNGMIAVLPAKDIRPGDRIVAARRIPPPREWGALPVAAATAPSGVLPAPVQALSQAWSSLGAAVVPGRDAPAAAGSEVSSKQLFNLLLMLGAAPGTAEGAAAGSPEGRVGGGDHVLVEVTRVRRVDYSGYVYDFAVEGNNSFIGGYGVVYHNSDPYGFYIYSVYKIGSIQLSYESERLATPKARFLGVMMTDIFGWRSKKAWLSERERRAFIIKAKDVDVKRAKELLKYPWFKTAQWRRELGIFLKKKVKLEIEALASKGLKFLAFKYIPEKIETGDWIE